ncbi:uncharacterized protein PAC_11621 [Phialocephala subalpina]|uniref:Uncharacterized protein n=1 Tax=Phialocephala subalpina TaxID=576137 RepID=A0A1L7X9M5_9HELO|nr:uncharacterized protein PAC_11621 [Phialocephala subalpina]
MYCLGGKVKRPSIEELKEVLNMQHLVRCIEYMYLSSTLDTCGRFGYDMQTSDCFREQADVMCGKWERRYGETKEHRQDRFYRPSTLPEPYNEPFFKAKEGGETEFLEPCEEEIAILGDEDKDKDVTSIQEEDVGFLRKFPAYNFDVVDDSEIGHWKSCGYAKIFRTFVSWFVEYSQARGLLEKTRKISIFLCGLFRVEETTMVAQIEDTRDILLVANPKLSSPGTKGQLLVNCIKFDIIMATLFENSRSPTRGLYLYCEHPDPPPMFEL